MGIIKKPRIHHYWSIDPLFYSPCFHAAMHRDRYKLIMRMFHLNNNDNELPCDDPNRDKWFLSEKHCCWKLKSELCIWLGQRYSLFVNNFYTSIKLFRHCYSNRRMGLVQCIKIRHQLPKKALKFAKRLEPEIPKWELPMCQIIGKESYFLLSSKKQVSGPNKNANCNIWWSFVMDMYVYGSNIFCMNKRVCLWIYMLSFIH